MAGCVLLLLSHPSLSSSLSEQVPGWLCLTFWLHVSGAHWPSRVPSPRFGGLAYPEIPHCLFPVLLLEQAVPS